MESLTTPTWVASIPLGFQDNQASRNGREDHMLALSLKNSARVNRNKSHCPWLRLDVRKWGLVMFSELFTATLQHSVSNSYEAISRDVRIS